MGEGRLRPRHGVCLPTLDCMWLCAACGRAWHAAVRGVRPCVACGCARRAAVRGVRLCSCACAAVCARTAGARTPPRRACAVCGGPCFRVSYARRGWLGAPSPPTTNWRSSKSLRAKSCTRMDVLVTEGLIQRSSRALASSSCPMATRLQSMATRSQSGPQLVLSRIGGHMSSLGGSLGGLIGAMGTQWERIGSLAGRVGARRGASGRVGARRGASSPIRSPSGSAHLPAEDSNVRRLPCEPKLRHPPALFAISDSESQRLSALRVVAARAHGRQCLDTQRGGAIWGYGDGGAIDGDGGRDAQLGHQTEAWLPILGQ